MWLLALGGACLLAGLDAGLQLAGSWAPVVSADGGARHGLVMVLGFMGTVIALERAQALRQAWAYLAPAVLGAGGIVLASGWVWLGTALLTEGTLLLAAVYVGLWRRAPLPLVAVQVLSAVLAFAAVALTFALPTADVVPLLIGFLVLTIAAERAELAQLAMGARAVPRLVGLAVALAGAVASSLVNAAWGARMLGVVLILVAAWLIADDVPRRLLRRTGLQRFNAVALLAGYCWLAVAGVTLVVAGLSPTSSAYDIAIHATFLGFGLSMILAHAPIIFPTVLARPLPYRALLWAPLLLLHTTLTVRVVGDLRGQGPVWLHGAQGTVVAVLLFVASAAYSTITARPKDRP